MKRTLVALLLAAVASTSFAEPYRQNAGESDRDNVVKSYVG